MKFCGQCQTNKPETEFNKNKVKKDGLNTLCKVCSRSRSKVYYQKNGQRHKEYVLNKRKEVRSEHKNKIDRIKDRGCLFCSEKEKCCLDFHHLNSQDKEKNISLLIRENRSWESIEKELKKCILVCSNCHRKLHNGILGLPMDFGIGSTKAD